jgi:hypothetical protein
VVEILAANFEKSKFYFHRRTPPASGSLHFHSAHGSLLIPDGVGTELMSRTTESPGAFTHVRGELAWTIAEHRTPSDAINMTRHLTDADEGRFELLGLIKNCEFALYWDYFWNHVVAARFDENGVDDLVRDVPEEIRYAGRCEYFDKADLDSWDWIHPRHQWRAE